MWSSVRPESGSFYANADNVSADVTTHIDETTRAVVLDLASVPVIDVSAVDMLVELDDDLRRRHIILCVARDIGQVRDVVETTGGAGLLEWVYPTRDDAVRALTQPPATNDGQPEEN